MFLVDFGCVRLLIYSCFVSLGCETGFGLAHQVPVRHAATPAAATASSAASHPSELLGSPAPLVPESPRTLAAAAAIADLPSPPHSMVLTTAPSAFASEHPPVESSPFSNVVETTASPAATEAVQQKPLDDETPSAAAVASEPSS